jgi:GNAT superfamily N-acetyltransferase
MLAPAMSISPASKAELPMIRMFDLDYLWLAGAEGLPSDRLGAYAETVPVLDRAVADGGRVLVGRAEGDIAGAVAWAPMAKAAAAAGRLLLDEEGRPAHVSHAPGIALIRVLFVHPDHQRFDVDRRLVLAAEADAAAEGQSFADVFATGFAVASFRSLGYRSVQPLRYRLAGGDSIPVLHMRKALPAALSAVA